MIMRTGNIFFYLLLLMSNCSFIHAAQAGEAAYIPAGSNWQDGKSALLHQSLHGYIEPTLRSWLLNLAYRWGSQEGRALAPSCTLDCHESQVCTLAVTPDGQTIVTASQDNALCIWNVPTGKCRHTLKGHTAPITDIKMVPCRNALLSASHDSTVRLWDLETGACLVTMDQHTGPVISLSLTPDGTLAVTLSTDNRACVWNLIEHTMTWIDCSPELLQQALISPDGKTVITRSGGKEVRVWDAVTGIMRYLRVGHPVYFIPAVAGLPWVSNISNLIVSPSYKTMVTIDSHTGLAGAYDITTGNLRCTLGKASPYIPLLIDDDSPPLDRDFIEAIAFSPDDDTAIVAFNKGSLQKVDLRTGVHQELCSLGFTIKSISFCPDGHSVVGCSTYNTLHAWDLNSEKMYMLDNSNPHYLATRGSHELICIPEVNAPLLSRAKNIVASIFRCNQYPILAQLSSDAQTAITSSESHTLVWNLPERSLRLVLPHLFTTLSGDNQEQTSGFMARMWHNYVCFSKKIYDNMALNNDGSCIASVTTDGRTVQVWNIGIPDPVDALENLSFLQVVLLAEIQKRMHDKNQRLVLRPGSDNHQAYTSLHPLIKNAIRPYIGIYQRRNPSLLPETSLASRLGKNN